MLTRRELLKGTAAAAAIAAPAALRAARRVGDKPNLLFLWTDQQRADTFAAYGNNTYRMPVMNRLASECVVFDRAYVTQPVCTPSRSSTLTGLWPHRSGCVTNNIPLRAETRTLPELLGVSAYRTAYMGKWHLGDEVFPQHGFQTWRSIEDSIYNRFYSPGRDRNARSSYHGFLVNHGYKPNEQNFFSRDFAARLPLEHTKASFLAREASDFILKSRREPWLLYVNFLEPHTPFTGPLNDLHSDEEAPLPRNFPGIPPAIPEGGEPEWYRQRRARFLAKPFEGFDLSTREGWQRIPRQYAGLCSQVDQALGRILWALEASGQAENTIIAFATDHGEMLGSHSMVAKSVMYEEAVRVPYLLRAPFRRHGQRRVTQPVSLIDTVPTLLELLGRKDAGELDGRSLVLLLEGRTRAPDNVYLQWNADQESPGSNARTVISPEYKLVLHERDHGMLFDRARDPLEMHNLFGEKGSQPAIRRLRSALDQWQQRTKDTLILPS